MKCAFQTDLKIPSVPWSAAKPSLTRSATRTSRMRPQRRGTLLSIAPTSDATPQSGEIKAIVQAAAFQLHYLQLLSRPPHALPDRIARRGWTVPQAVEAPGRLQVPRQYDRIRFRYGELYPPASTRMIEIHWLINQCLSIRPLMIAG